VVEALEREFRGESSGNTMTWCSGPAYGVLANSSDAEDVVQTIFLRLLDRGISPDVTKNPAGISTKAARERRR
jgi:hypothetical protein